MATSQSASSGSTRGGLTRAERKVIFASSLGTVFEWYDFYLYGSLAAIISKQFFSGVNPTAAFIFALLAFAAGFAVRPFGAVIFGRIGDMIKCFDDGGNTRTLQLCNPVEGVIVLETTAAPRTHWSILS